MELKTTAIEGTAITALQKTEHAIGPMPFSWPAQPLHLPDMDMSVGIGISLAMEVDDMEPMSKPAKPCMTRPAAKMRAARIAETRRSLMNAICSS
jgi:hypothetical protein